MSLLPSRPEITDDGEPRVVGLDSEEADDLMAALSSETARRVLSELHEEPAPPGELADRVDTSLQNAQYHLGRLEDAGAVEVVGTAYSEKGREMSVYGPADSPLVIFAGEKERTAGLRSAIAQLFAGFLALGVVSVALEALLGEGIFSGTADEAPEDEEIGALEEPDDAPAPESDAVPQAADGLEAILEGLFAGGLSPGLAFFLGGAVVLTVVIGLPYLRARWRAKRDDR